MNPAKADKVLRDHASRVNCRDEDKGAGGGTNIKGKNTPKRRRPVSETTEVGTGSGRDERAMIRRKDQTCVKARPRASMNPPGVRKLCRSGGWPVSRKHLPAA